MQQAGIKKASMNIIRSVAILVISRVPLTPPGGDFQLAVVSQGKTGPDDVALVWGFTRDRTFHLLDTIRAFKSCPSKGEPPVLASSSAS